MTDKQSNQPILGVLPSLEDTLPLQQSAKGWATDNIVVNGQMLTVIFPDEESPTE